MVKKDVEFKIPLNLELFSATARWKFGYFYLRTSLRFLRSVDGRLLYLYEFPFISIRKSMKTSRTGYVARSPAAAKARKAGRLTQRRTPGGGQEPVSSLPSSVAKHEKPKQTKKCVKGVRNGSSYEGSWKDVCTMTLILKGQ